MSEQLDLLARVLPPDTVRLDDWHPGNRPARARAADPESSHAAADRAEQSGRIGKQLAIAIELVKKFPGRTSGDLARAAVLDRYQLARRLPEAERRGLVLATVHGAEEVRWWAPGVELPKGVEVRKR